MILAIDASDKSLPRLLICASDREREWSLASNVMPCTSCPVLCVSVGPQKLVKMKRNVSVQLLTFAKWMLGSDVEFTTETVGGRTGLFDLNHDLNHFKKSLIYNLFNFWFF